MDPHRRSVADGVGCFSDDHAVQPKADGQYFGTAWEPNDWLLKKEKLPFGNYLYYIVTYSDEDQTLTYPVIILDSYDHTSRTTFPGVSA